MMDPKAQNQNKTRKNEEKRGKTTGKWDGDVQDA